MNSGSSTQALHAGALTPRPAGLYSGPARPRRRHRCGRRCCRLGIFRPPIQEGVKQTNPTFANAWCPVFPPARLCRLPSSVLPHRVPTKAVRVFVGLPAAPPVLSLVGMAPNSTTPAPASHPRRHPTRPDTSHRPSSHRRHSRRGATTRRRSWVFPHRSPPCTLCALSTGRSLAARWIAPTPGPRRSLPRSSARARAGTCTPRRSARWSATPTPSAGTGTISWAAIPTGA